jgi:hypothetical protein
MSSKKSPPAKRRKSSESSSPVDDTQQPIPSPPQYYTSPQHYPTQYSSQGGHPFAPHLQQSYRTSPPHTYGAVPPTGYPAIPPMHQLTAHGHPGAGPTNTFVTPDSQLVPSSSVAFGSPPSSLRRQPFVDSSSSVQLRHRPCKFIHLLCCTYVKCFRSKCFELRHLGAL